MAKTKKPARTAARRARSTAGKSARAPATAPLEQIRERIDAVDAQLHALINERARLAQRVGVSKHASGHTVDFYRPEREAQVLRLALSRNQDGGGPLRDEEILRLFREIMSACLAQQNALKIGYLGPEGTFTQQAVLEANEISNRINNNQMTKSYLIWKQYQKLLHQNLRCENNKASVPTPHRTAHNGL